MDDSMRGFLKIMGTILKISLTVIFIVVAKFVFKVIEEGSNFNRRW